MSIVSPWAIRDLLDTRLKTTTPGLKTYLRLRTDTVPNREFEEYGFQIVNVGANVNDILIVPPPSVTPMSMHNIGIVGGRLQFGAHQFDISDTFTRSMLPILKVTDGYSVWRHTSVIGLIYNGSVFSLESVVPKSVNDSIIRWIISGNQIEPLPSVQP